MKDFPPTTTIPDRSKKESRLFAHCVLICACILFPTLITAMAPVSYVRFTKTRDVIDVESKTCLMFAIPYSVQRLSEFQSVDDRKVEGEMMTSFDRDNPNPYRAEDSGYLILKGAEKTIEVSVDPKSIPGKRRAINDFLADQAGKNLTLFCVHNWNAFLFEIPLCLLTALYLFVIADSFGRGLLRFVQK